MAEPFKTAVFQVGDYRVVPDQLRIEGPGGPHRVTPKVMGVLVVLAEAPGETVSKDALLDQVWPRTPGSDGLLANAIAELRRIFTDDARDPRYIETIPKTGYRLIAEVAAAVPAEPGTTPRPARLTRAAITAVVVLGLAVSGYLLIPERSTSSVTPLSVPANALAVLPFVNMSAEPANEYFSDGISEELLNALAQNPELQVTARTSAFKYKNSQLSVPDIARELKVASVLEGSVRKQGDEVRITAQLIDAESGYHLWSETYDRNLDDIFEVQSEIAGAISAALAGRLGDATPVALPQQHEADDPAAFDSYLRGLSHLNRQTLPDAEAALQEFQRAIELDPGFVPAYVGLSRANFSLFFYGQFALEELDARIRPLVSQALALDPEYGEAWMLKGWFHGRLRERDLEAEAYKNALDLAPGNVDVLMSYALHDPRQSLALASKAVELDPLSAQARFALGVAYINETRYEEAERELLRSVELNPNNSQALIRLQVLARFYFGRVDEGVRYVYQAYLADPDVAFNPSMLHFLYMSLGDFERAAAWRRLVLQRWPDTHYAFGVELEKTLYEGDLDRATGLAGKLAEALPTNPNNLGLRQREALESGRFFFSLALYQKNQPALLSDAPKISGGNVYMAIPLLQLLEAMGDTEQEKIVRDAIESWIANTPRAGGDGLRYYDAHYYSVIGDYDAALAALQAHMDAGLLTGRSWQLEKYPWLDDELKQRPEFLAIIAELREREAEQLANISDIPPP